MNLKEAFRYQNCLSSLMRAAGMSLTAQDHAFNVTKKHLRSKANAEAEDEIEVVDLGEFFKNDDVLAFMQRLVDEREKLTVAIGKAKAVVGFDIDAAIETNKFRQELSVNIKEMLRNKASKRVDRGVGYRFNAEGNQCPYYYDVETERTEAFDRGKAKAVASELMKAADKTSADIDAAMVNTDVAYEPPFNVNCSFDDCMEVFLSENR